MKKRASVLYAIADKKSINPHAINLSFLIERYYFHVQNLSRQGFSVHRNDKHMQPPRPRSTVNHGDALVADGKAIWKGIALTSINSATANKQSFNPSILQSFSLHFRDQAEMLGRR